ncbi:MAG: NTP transferase domain-containing protein [Phycisphaerales bacterium]|nr:MAG: NTP transferase domain-containing protein [Phycisphaerales bacterium]
MIKIDGMLMIGSAGANVGKTELACALVRRLSRNHDIAGIKVTTINDKDGQCPRGGEGCGVCSSLPGDFCITAETDNRSGKDTSRLSAAGASPVYWLRVLKTHLQEGAAALLDTLGPYATCICESNSLRCVVEPGLFLLARRKDSSAWKESAQQLGRYADRIVTSHEGTFDLDLERIHLVDGKWKLREKATAIVLAGGSSRRMGMDKSLLPINGRPLVARICRQLRDSFEQMLVSADDVDKFAFLGLEVVPDRIPGQGPLMGIASTLEASANELNFVLACDIPHVALRYVRKMLSEAVESSADIVVPITGEGQYEPLFAVYRKSALKAINKVLLSGGRKIADAFKLCGVRYIELDTNLANLNTIAEYVQFQRDLGARP